MCTKYKYTVYTKKSKEKRDGWRLQRIQLIQSELLKTWDCFACTAMNSPTPAFVYKHFPAPRCCLTLNFCSLLFYHNAMRPANECMFVRRVLKFTEKRESFTFNIIFINCFLCHSWRIVFGNEFAIACPSRLFGFSSGIVRGCNISPATPQKTSQMKCPSFPNRSRRIKNKGLYIP